eukprot:UN03567
MSAEEQKTTQVVEEQQTTSEPEQQQQQAPLEGEHVCISPGCGKPASMRCPKCLEYDVTTSYFCGQECFKANWAVHSRSHVEYRGAKEFVVPKIKYTGPLRPAYVTPQVKVLDPKIKKPDYAETGIPISERTAKAAMTAPVYTKEEQEGIRAACKLTRAALDFACNLIRPGITTDEIDKKTHAFIIERGGYPSPLNYHNFPKSICTSINEVICHGIPSYTVLKEGDIINIDVSVYLNGFHGDANETHMVGECDWESMRLLKASYDSLFAAIKMVKPTVLFRDFGAAVSQSIRKHGYSSVRSYCGHGIGALFHCMPNIPHYADNKAAGSCKPGMVFCIEPMINAGVWKDTHWPDDWTAVTLDGARSAQFEHTILCTATGYELLTDRTENSKPYWWEMPQYAEQLAKYQQYCKDHSNNKSSGSASSAKIPAALKAKQAANIKAKQAAAAPVAKKPAAPAAAKPVAPTEEKK